MLIAARRGRERNPDIVLGLCGEHGGDPSSVRFCKIAGFDYVSCSPFRVPIARLAAAQATLLAGRGGRAAAACRRSDRVMRSRYRSIGRRCGPGEAAAARPRGAGGGRQAGAGALPVGARDGAGRSGAGGAARGGMGAPRGIAIGLTGPPGVGKSSLCNALVAELRARGRDVAVIAVDPSSRRSGGALLGDRARIEADPDDAGVFIRSMAARRRLGGLADLTFPGRWCCCAPASTGCWSRPSASASRRPRSPTAPTWWCSACSRRRATGCSS